MIQLFLLLFFIFGTVVGSFLNVVAYRSVNGGSVFFGSSICPKCKHKLGPADLVPIVSFLFLRGRCRYCGNKISFQYPLVELAGGALFAFTFYSWYQTSGLAAGEVGITYQELIYLIYVLFSISVLIALFTTDIVDGLLPNGIVLSAIVVVGLYKAALLTFGLLSLSSFSYSLLAALTATSVFYAIVYLSGERALGGGDVKLVFLIGIATGWPAFLVALFAAFLTGGFVAVMLIITGKRRFGQTVPLGPFLSFGAFLALFWGQQIIDLYFKTFL